MPVKGVTSLKRNVANFFDHKDKTATKKVLLAISMTAAGYAKLETPVDTDALINSQGYKLINDNKSGVVFYGAGFSDIGFNYGKFLHDNVYKDGSEVNWSPRKKATAKHHFLSNAFENDDYQADYLNIIKKGYRL